MSFSAVIPARLASSRLPGKVLRELAGRPMICHVIDAARASAAEEVIVATDDERVAQAVADVGCAVELTDAAHPSGSDRIREVADRRGWDDGRLIVGVQGDEPLLPPALIDQLAAAMAADAGADWGTLATPVLTVEEYFDPNAVKLVTDAQGHALYFSRAPIPWDRERSPKRELPRAGAWRHIGMYAYRAGALRRVCGAPAATLEQCEMLEQLRALSLGLKIRVLEALTPPPPGVDTEQDLLAVAERLAQRPA